MCVNATTPQITADTQIKLIGGGFCMTLSVAADKLQREVLIWVCRCLTPNANPPAATRLPTRAALAPLNRTSPRAGSLARVKGSTQCTVGDVSVPVWCPRIATCRACTHAVGSMNATAAVRERAEEPVLKARWWSANAKMMAIVCTTTAPTPTTLH